MSFDLSMQVAGAGMRTQSERLRIVAENLANAETTSLAPGDEPYRRKTVVFAVDETGDERVALPRIRRYGTDRTPFEAKFEPGHPAADADGYVLYPNVNPLFELMDMREAQRSYEANLNAMQMAVAMTRRTIDLLR